MASITLINQSKKINSTQAKVLAAGLQKYGNLVAKAWGLEVVKVSLIDAPANWKFYIVDELPAGSPPNALGWHDYIDDKVISYTSTKLTMPVIDPALPKVSPFGIIIPMGDGTESLMPMSLFEILSHELSETLVDPTVNRYALAPDGKMWLLETGDNAAGYRFVMNVNTLLLNGRATTRMICQDFCLPSFYEAQGHSGPYSYANKVSAPFTVDQGCYATMYPTGAEVNVGFDLVDGD